MILVNLTGNNYKMEEKTSYHIKAIFSELFIINHII